MRSHPLHPHAVRLFQDVSSKNTIDQMADPIAESNDIGLWPVSIPEKVWEYWLKYETDSF